MFYVWKKCLLPELFLELRILRGGDQSQDSMGQSDMLELSKSAGIKENLLEIAGFAVVRIVEISVFLKINTIK